MINFILMNLIVYFGVHLLIKYFFKFESALDRIIAFFVLFISWIIIALQLLGVLNALFFKNIIIFNLCILFTIYLIIKALKEKGRGGRSFKELITDIDFGKTEYLCISLILGFLLIKIFVNLINPPFGWDDLNYHFTFPVEWMKNGNLINPIVVSDDPFPSYYPIAGSLLFFWLMLPFKNVFLADIAQLPFFIFSFFAILAICRKLRLNSKYAFFAACLFVIIPNYFKQLQIGYVDIMIGSLFLISLNFLMAVREKFNFSNFIIFSLSFAVFIGVKTTALAYSMYILLPFLLIVYLQKQYNLKTKISYLSLFFLILFFVGCFSYLKNLNLTGNPFYPLHVSLMGKSIFKGVIDKATFISRNEEAGYSLAKLLFHEGLGMQSLFLVFPAAFIAFPVNFLRNKNRDLFLNYLLLLPLLLYLSYRFILPIPNSRYLYSMLGLGMVSGFFLLHSLKVHIKIIKVATVIFLIASAAECARRLELCFSMILSLVLFVSFVLYHKHSKIKSLFFTKKMIILFLSITLLAVNLFFLDNRKNEYARYIKNSRYWPDATYAWDWINSNTKGNNIAYVGRPVPFPLYGENFKNNVYYVSVNNIDPIFLHDLINSNYSWGPWKDDAINMHKNFKEDNNYRGKADYSVWLNNLKKRKTDFLFIYSLHHTNEIIFPLEDEWARDHSDKFIPVFNNETIRVYKLDI